MADRSFQWTSRQWDGDSVTVRMRLREKELEAEAFSFEPTIPGDQERLPLQSKDKIIKKFPNHVIELHFLCSIVVQEIERNVTIASGNSAPRAQKVYNRKKKAHKAAAVNEEMNLITNSDRGLVEQSSGRAV
ncbi:uncharacterized protein G2W53_018225 [Senna tora]|uniref:Uncharacterized protein n=1 Tax=Senna tora TaxID=362788 RepID=A0A834WPN6_9FABA|nr:uncharacterized protein G2W53_018225 [Senna tora]